ncbi:MAG: hypothetical protein PHR20_05015 [Bacteroidales bacterium]|nr:hypothetical protein [Bacteroidales bacterium]
MKRNNIIIASLLSIVLVLFNSCIEEGHGDLTKRGQEIFGVWNQIISENIENNSNIAFVFNSYLEAEDNIAAEQIRINDLNNAYIIEQEDMPNTWHLIYDNIIYYTISTNGKTLSEINAEWNITIRSDKYYLNGQCGSQYVKVTHPDESSWNLSVSNSLNPESTINVSIVNTKGVPTTIFNSEFQITGYGHVAVKPELNDAIFDGDSVFMDFVITSQMQHKFYKVFSDGGIDLSVTNSRGERTFTSASCFNDGIYNNYALITYREVTDTIVLPIIVPEGYRWVPLTSFE